MVNMCNMDHRNMVKKKFYANVEKIRYYRDVFTRCDKNNDGFVSLSELQRFIEANEDQKIPESVVKAIYKNFDSNGDEQLDFYEFLDMVNNPVTKRVFKRLQSSYLKFAVVSNKRHQLTRQYTVISITGQYEDEATCKKYTVGMITLSLIQILFFYINLACKNETHPEGLIEEAFKFSPLKKQEIWRYVTHIFVHGSAMHLYPNLFIQILFGIPLEMVHSWRVLVIYVAGALGGCLAQSVIVPEAELIGGSGGFYAFYTAHIATVIMNWREMSHPSVQVMLFGIMTIFDPIYNYIILRESGSVSYIAHLGGAIVGLLLGVNILRNLHVTKNENVIWYICFVSYIILMSVFITLDIVNTNVNTINRA